MDWGKLIYAFLNPEYQTGESLTAYYFGVAFEVQKTGNFLQTVKMNLWEGQLANFSYALEHGRLLQTLALFLFGMLVDRRGLLLYNEKNEQLWLKTLGWALIGFFPLYALYNMMPEYIRREALLAPLNVIVGSLKNLSFMLILVTGLLLTFYRSKNKRIFMPFTSYGRMSLTHYIGQSVIGSLLFYHWGFELGRYLGITYSFIFGIVFVLLQMAFSSWWLRCHKQGPFEGWWKRLTWIHSQK